MCAKKSLIMIWRYIEIKISEMIDMIWYDMKWFEMRRNEMKWNEMKWYDMNWMIWTEWYENSIYYKKNWYKWWLYDIYFFLMLHFSFLACLLSPTISISSFETPPRPLNCKDGFAPNLSGTFGPGPCRHFVVQCTRGSRKHAPRHGTSRH